MEVKLQKIGNSRGLRLPKKIIEKCDIAETVELHVIGKTITITSKRKPRQGWAEAAKEMHRCGEDKPVIHDNLDNHILAPWE